VISWGVRGIVLLPVASISNNSYLVCSTGMRLVEAAFFHQAETYERAATERRRRTATFVYSSLLHHRRCFCNIWYGQIITLSLFTLQWSVACSAKSGHGPGARHDCVRGHCNGTRYVVWQVSHQYIEAEIVCCLAHGNRCRLRLYSRIAVRGGVAMKNPQNIRFFVTNFQTVTVVYKEVLSWLWYFCN